MQRERYLDVVCGIMVIWMILGHAIAYCGLKDSFLYTFPHRFLPFFMPWFFFKSGMFYVQRTEKQVVMGVVRRLLVPYLTFIIGTYIIFDLYPIPKDGLWNSLFQYMTPIIQTGAPAGNIALWFLLSLFFVRVLSNQLIVFGIKPFVVCIVLAVGMVLLHHVKQQAAWIQLAEPRYLYNTLVGLLFYSAGAWLKQRQFERRVMFVSLGIHLVIVIFFFSFVDMFPNELQDGYYSLWIVSSITGCIVINNLFRYCCKANNFPLLQYVGENSMTFFLVHFWVLNVASSLFSKMGFDNSYLRLLFLLIACVFSLPIVNGLLRKNNLRWMIGEKKCFRDNSRLRSQSNTCTSDRISESSQVTPNL